MNFNPNFESLPGFTKLYIIGAGGFAREVEWLASECGKDKFVSEFVVSDPEYLTSATNATPCKLLSGISVDTDSRYVVAIGDSKVRKKIVAECEKMGLISTRLIHSRFEASRSVEVGSGSIICCGVVATVNVKIGEHVHINLNCTIGHDVEIGDYCTISPGVHISGNVRIGSGVFIGTGATIINGTTSSPIVIGDNAILAAGACVTKSVEESTMVAGVPAVKKR